MVFVTMFDIFLDTLKMEEYCAGSKYTQPQENFIKRKTTEGQNRQTEPERKSTFTGYGCQTGDQHPFYRTTSREYGWYPPDKHTAPSVYYPTERKFSSHLAAAGMYRNHSLNTTLDK